MIGSVSATARLAWLEPFQAIDTRSQSAPGGVSVGGHIITGRPVLNSAAFSVFMPRLRLTSGFATQTMSASRPWRLMTSTCRPSCSTQEADALVPSGASERARPSSSVSERSSSRSPSSSALATSPLWARRSFFIEAEIGTPNGIMSSARGRQWVMTTWASWRRASAAAWESTLRLLPSGRTGMTMRFIMLPGCPRRRGPPPTPTRRRTASLPRPGARAARGCARRRSAPRPPRRRSR